MKYSFMTKTSFLALCVAALTPFYLLAGGGESDPTEKKPARIVVGNLTLASQRTLGDETATTSTPVVTASTPVVTSSLLPGATEELPEDEQAGAASAQSWRGVSSDLQSIISELSRIFDNLRSSSLRVGVLLDSLESFNHQRQAAENFGVDNPSEKETCLAMLSLISSDLGEKKPTILNLKEESDGFWRSQLLTEQNNERNEFGERWRRIKGGRSDFNFFEKFQKETERVAFQMRHIEKTSEFEKRLAAENVQLSELLARI